MTIKLDESTTSVVVYCTECGHWRAFTWTMLEGHESAVRHERLVHPDAQQAQAARDMFVKRHAARSPIVGKSGESSLHGNVRQVQDSARA